MGVYILRRLFVYIPLLFLVTIIVFALALAAPGDPADWLNTPELNLSFEQVQAMRESMGLTDPPPVRYAKWLGEVVQGNFGFRLKNGDAVGPLIAVRLQRTLFLTGSAMTIGIVFGLTLGIYSALNRYSILDHLATTLTFMGISVPAFVVGIIGLWLFALKLGWFPVGGIMTPGANPNDWQDFFRHLILPALLLSTNQVASYFRYMRMSMLDVLHAEYLNTARAKGLRPTRVIFVHALRNALLPIITIIGLSIPSLFGGALFIETIFSWPGMGLLFIDGVNSRDYPLILAITLIAATVILLANLLTDITYSLVDPRIRLTQQVK